MALPKHRTSKSKKRMRRAHYKAQAPSLAKCSHCHQPKPSHEVCPNCGYYGGREIVKPREKEE